MRPSILGREGTTSPTSHPSKLVKLDLRQERGAGQQVPASDFLAFPSASQGESTDCVPGPGDRAWDRHLGNREQRQ